MNVRRENKREEIEMRQDRVEHLHFGIYDEIGESLIGVDNRDPRVAPQLRNTRAIITDIQTMKLNYNDQEDNSTYLDPYFAVNETESQNSLKESTSSFSSSVGLVILDHTGYLNSYQPLLEREQQISDGYKVAIHVHQNFESSSGSKSTEDGRFAYKYSHVYQQLHQDQSTNTHLYEKATLNEKEFNHSEKNEKERCSNQVSADKKDINSSNLLYDKETDENINEHVLFVCQRIGDDANTVTVINADDKDNNDSLGNTDGQINKDNNKTFNDRNCTEHVPHVDISNEYLDMQSLTKKEI